MTVKQEESAVCPPDALEKRIQQAQLTKCQHRIADYFLKNRNRICRMTSLAIAQEVGVSDASVIRFSRAVGYTGFAANAESSQQHREPHGPRCHKQSSCRNAQV